MNTDQTTPFRSNLIWDHIVCNVDYGILDKREQRTNEPQHKITNNVVCETSKGSDQPGHTRRLIRAFASCWNIL